MMAIDELLSLPAFGADPTARQAVFERAMVEALEHHRDHCEPFRTFLEVRRMQPGTWNGSLEALPFLPAKLFKRLRLQSVPDDAVKRVLSSSATSSQVPSTVVIDRLTSNRQRRCLARELASLFGSARRPYLICDALPTRHCGSMELSARAAGMQGFLLNARQTVFLMDETATGPRFEPDRLAEELERCDPATPPVIIGYTYILYDRVVRQLLENGRSVSLPEGSAVLHFGGWKRLADAAVSAYVFSADVCRAFGVAPSAVWNVYGFTEQLGVVYPGAGVQPHRVPTYAEVLVRDPLTLKCCADGTPGVLQFITPLPHSYPGISILVEDMGRAVERCPVTDRIEAFEVLGRVSKAEIRGCGDTLPDAVYRASSAAVASRKGPVRVLYPRDWNGPADIGTVQRIAESLRVAQQKLACMAIDDIIGLLSAVGRSWAASAAAFGAAEEIGFLPLWLRYPNLRSFCDRSLRGNRLFLDRFHCAGDKNHLVRAYPRGLSVHWIAGNSPVIGMLSLVAAWLSKNVSIVKTSSRDLEVLPRLLSIAEQASYVAADGTEYSGRDLCAACAVIHAERTDTRTAECLSELADVRIAWGGLEAVESIMRLPRRFGTEDVIFGPRLSFAVVGVESLGDSARAAQAATAIARDAVAFGQRGCNSPHTVFVEQGAPVSPLAFSEMLSSLLDGFPAAKRMRVSAEADALQILTARTEHEMYGRAFYQSALPTSVLYREQSEPALNEPCYFGTLYVRPVRNVFDVVPLCSRTTQTIGLAAGSRAEALAAACAARGVSRCTALGNMSLYDAPWDDMYPLDRLVRWVSLDGKACA